MNDPIKAAQVLGLLTCVFFSSLPAVGKTLEGVIQHLCTCRQGLFCHLEFWVAITEAENGPNQHLSKAMEPFKRPLAD